jgi:hypothetical protein
LGGNAAYLLRDSATERRVILDVVALYTELK